MCILDWCPMSFYIIPHNLVVWGDWKKNERKTEKTQWIQCEKQKWNTRHKSKVEQDWSNGTNRFVPLNEKKE